VVPKHRRRIVDRNRLRRRIREIGRTRVLPRLAELGRAMDVLVRARREAYEASFSVLEAELTELVEALWSGES
jgi:ribonuclease P protein component